MAITKEQIDLVFQARDIAFDALSDTEDREEKLKTQIEATKDGTLEMMELQKKLREMQPELTLLKRKFIKSNWEVDRIRMMLSTQTQ